MSDGFSALTYDYKRAEPADLVCRAREEGLSALLRELRHVERNDDPEMRLYPRFTCSDDATAVLFRAVPGAL